MPDRFMDALTGRRLGGALSVLGGLAVAAIVLWPSGDHAAPARPAKIQLVRIVSVPELGLAFAHPSTWRRSVAGGVNRPRSPERGTLVTFASPTPGSHTQRLKADIKRVLRERFSPAKIVRDGRGKLGAPRASTFELEGLRPGGPGARARGRRELDRPPSADPWASRQALAPPRSRRQPLHRGCDHNFA